MLLKYLGQAFHFVLLLTLLMLIQAHASARAPLILRDPSLSKSKIAFSYAGRIWIVNRDGSNPRCLTSGGNDSKPSFSPDGSQIAFIGNDHGEGALYTIPSTGGVPRRLTYHPGDFSDSLPLYSTITWTPDGRSIVFSSPRAGFTFGQPKLYRVSVEGGAATPLPLAPASGVSFSADGARIAYTKPQNIPPWRHYRGGATSSISIARISDFATEATIPRDNSNDFNPMWIGDTLYFLSDRSGPVSLFSYNIRSMRVEPVISNKGFDVNSAAAFSDSIVYAKFGELHVLNIGSRVDEIPDIRLKPPSEGLSPHVQKISARDITTIDLSPSGDDVVLAAHGEIFTVPVRADHGDGAMNLTNTGNVDERGPAWSPDGKSIAYFSDASGEYALEILSQPEDNGTARSSKRTRVSLNASPSPDESPSWSPDSTKIAYMDQEANYWYIDLKTRKQVRFDSGLHFFYVSVEAAPELAWAPDSRWMAYTKEMPNRMHAVYIYSVESGRTYQVTDSTVDALHVVFDKGGEYLYFTLSTDVSLRAGISMSGYDRSVTRRACIVTLRQESELPFVRREGDSEDGFGVTASPTYRAVAGAMRPSPGQNIQIDVHDIGRRIWALPISAGNYTDLYVGRPGVVFLVERDEPPIPSYVEHDTFAGRVTRLDLNSLETDEVLSRLDTPSPLDFPRPPPLRLSFNGDVMLYRSREQWFVTHIDSMGKFGQSDAVLRKPLPLDNLEVKIDPRAEWAHMYDQVWRDVRNLFYDPGLHGLDLDAAKRRYRPYLKGLSTRADLNDLFGEMLGDLTASHLGVFEPPNAAPDRKSLPTGLLGADYAVEHGRYRFVQIYRGENWNPALRAPLGSPDADVTGEYLLTVNGREVSSKADIYSFFQGTAGKEVILGVSRDPDDRAPRTITVTPVANEIGLRTHAWAESNRRRVDQLTEGRVAYIYLPDVLVNNGYREFNRYYFAQSGKQAVIVDERYNGGGWAPDYIIDMLGRPLLDFIHARSGSDMTIPAQGIFGPKVMIINELARSGGDHLAYMFRKAGLGQLVGRRTYGALLGACAWDHLLDGSAFAIADCGNYTPDGTWIENNGVEPDIDVVNDPLVGGDAQLEAAIRVTMDLLTKRPALLPPHHPPYPRYQRSWNE